MRTKIEIMLSIIIFSLAFISIYEICRENKQQTFMPNSLDVYQLNFPYDTVYAQTSTVFSLVVYPDSIDFKDMWPGTTKSNFPAGGIIANVRNNYPNITGWGLKIHVIRELTSSSSTIPNTYFWHRSVSTEGGGTHYDPTYADNSTFSTTAKLYYDCIAPACSTTTTPGGRDIRTYLKLTIPTSQKPGLYFTTIIFTLTATL